MKPQFWQLVRFGLVGVANTASFYLIYLALHPFLPYFAAFTIAFLLSMVGSFFMNTYFTYRTRPTWKKFLLFPLPNISNYLVQSFGVVALVQWLKLDSRIAPLVASVVAIPITFVLSKIILTGRAGEPAPAPARAERSGSAEIDELAPVPVPVEVVDK
ncbi:GtrA family protein [Kitasatospora sp. GP82]|uniref:GtrA family protein n=1 Tax=Kitasatospora sp. GP82 TaxID=3035089 RepID=UPI00247536BB|nr:GtrA family protein [Kitasatospora sp. GP82]MDH6128704.1 putative flippase GtrA [Kitasatospora sp. GP82]